ncbi:hypothetical protein KSF_025450 [Reticulibacter mediterranei]|uniref:Winged helix DNA-binding domain-containing protein n=1 Tax=Reticulibacter mediterranei TaxID=2778369 RepID=A0A8J3N027_9CHLR|nr:winged helix DNA-binding domain-containing protein [Reticulibacter mediterranei]GHO92497.1 hypothetical protein KSF_025450 [Reticulibacter mediterranei]
MTEHVLTLRELNRATLARQFLLEQTDRAPLEVIRWLVALQGQVSNAPYIGLWTRLQAFQRADLTALLENKQVLRASSLRGTLHIIAADDYLLFQPLLKPALTRNLHLFAQRTEGFDLDHFIAEMQAYIREQPRTAVELRAKMEELYPGMGKQQIADSVRMHMALIQILPAGTWGFTGKPIHMEASMWLERPFPNTDFTLPQLVLRYLTAFGPASVKDIQQWSGITGIRQTIEALRPELFTFRDEQGRELFDLPDAPRPSEDTPVPVRFLPEFENLLFSYEERGRIVDRAYFPSIFMQNGLNCATFLVDGFVAGAWKIERGPTSATLAIHPFNPLASDVQAELQAEGERLMRWVLDGADAFDIRVMKG